MPTYEIYSLGDANYLAAVLNAVAALGGSGTYASLMSLSLLMGVLILAFQAISNGGGRFDIQIFILSIVAYWIIFLPKANLVIYDTYTGSARQVDNVPFGLAFIGSALNQVGYGITEKMELAFSTPNMTTNGFAGALSTMLNAQRVDSLGIADHGCTEAPQADAKYDSLSQGDRSCSLTRTISSYIGTCVVAAIQRGERTAQDIYRAENVINALRTDYTIPTVSVFIGQPAPMPPGGWSVNCADAYGLIQARVQSSNFNAGFNQYLIGRFGELDPTAALGGAMSALSNAAYNAQDFMINMALRDAVTTGFTTYTNRNDAVIASSIITSGAAQRNIQWAAEATLFSKLIRPLITFFEGMMFATAPFVAFLLGLGGFGLKIAMKYLYLPIWVSMWMPVMAICNLYVNIVAQGRMAAFETGAAGSYTSMAGAAVMFSSLTDWLGTASMLASSVPALTMSLLFGGAVAMSSLAGRLQSGDYTNEKLPAPDAASPAAALNVQSGYTAAPTTGAANTNIAGQLTGLSSGTTARAIEQQQRSFDETSSRALSSAFEQSASGLFQSGNRVESLAKLENGAGGTRDEAVQNTLSKVGSEFSAFKLSGGASNIVQNSVGLASSLGANAAGAVSKIASNLGAQLGIGANDASQERKDFVRAFESATRMARETRYADSAGGSFSERFAAGLSDTDVNTYLAQAGVTNGQALRDTAQSIQSERQTLTSTGEQASSLAAQTSLDPLAVASRVRREPAAQAAIRSAESNPVLQGPLAEERNRLAGIMPQRAFGEEGDQRAAIDVAALNNLSGQGGAVGREALRTMGEIAVASGLAAPTPSNPTNISPDSVREFIGQGPQATDASTIRPAAQAAAADARRAAGNASAATAPPPSPGRTGADIRADATSQTPGFTNVREPFLAGAQDANSLAQRQQAQIADPVVNRTLDQLESGQYNAKGPAFEQMKRITGAALEASNRGLGMLASLPSAVMGSPEAQAAIQQSADMVSTGIKQASRELQTLGVPEKLADMMATRSMMDQASGSIDFLSEKGSYFIEAVAKGVTGDVQGAREALGVVGNGVWEGGAGQATLPGEQFKEFAMDRLGLSNSRPEDADRIAQVNAAAAGLDRSYQSGSFTTGAMLQSMAPLIEFAQATDPSKRTPAMSSN